jgi:hypothetical protein
VRFDIVVADSESDGDSDQIKTSSADKQESYACAELAPGKPALFDLFYPIAEWRKAPLVLSLA